MIGYPPGGMSWPATVTKIHDGDTVTLDVDLRRYAAGSDQTLGFHLYIQNRHLHIHQALRLFGINAAELATPAGAAAHQALLDEMPIGSAVELTTWLDTTDKYGRLLGRITLAGLDVNQWLVDNGWAATWDGHGPKPIP